MTILPTIKSNQNIQIPAMIYGTAWKKEATTKLVKQAIKCGFRGIDTAGQPRHYQEDLVGVALKELYEENIVKREELFLETKFTPKDGQDPNNMPYNPNSSLKEQILTSFESSKKNLYTSYIDSYLLHSPLFPFTKTLEAWRILEELVEKGEVKQIGISNCYDISAFKKLYNEATIKPSVLQNRFYSDSSYDKELRQFCLENNIIYLGFWTLSANPHILGSKIIFDLVRKYKRSEPQIFYRFLSQIGIIPLNGTTNEVHMKEDLSIFDFVLDDNEIIEINKLLS